MNRLIADLALPIVALIVILFSSGCYTQLAVSEEGGEEAEVQDIIILYSPYPPLPPTCPIVVLVDCPAGTQPDKPDAPRRDFGSQRTDTGERKGDGRTRGAGGWDQ